MPIIARDKKVKHEYEFLKTYQAGIVLTGREVKSIKNGRISLSGSFIVPRNGELFLLNASIPLYQPANNPEGHNPERTRKLLVNKSEIREIIGIVSRKGLTIKPLSVYTKKGKIKLEFGIARHKKTRDKREKIMKKETERDIKRALKSK